jgi:lipopolysaccharide export system protein LptA
MIKRVFVVVLFSLLTYSGFAQSGKIQILNANTFELEQRGVSKVKKLIGEVHLRQDNTDLKCDSAYVFDESNYVEAYQHVQIIHNDSVSFYGDILKYDGQKKVARLQQHVSMVDPSSTLVCDELEFDLRANKASYTSGGKLTSGQSVLTSKIGYYLTNTRELYFKKDVQLNSPEFNLRADTLRYNTQTKIATFFGRTVINSVDDTIYCNLGTYQTERQNGLLRGSVKIRSKESTMYADSVLYDRRMKYSKALGNIKIIDTINNLIVTGGVGETFGLSKKSYVTRGAVVFNVFDKDTMSIKADSIWVLQRNQSQRSDMIRAYFNVRIYKSDIQAICDSLVFIKSDSMMTLYRKPILWSDENQISGDTIVFYINNRQLDSMRVLSSAFVISKETNKHFNQIKGRFLTARFSNRKVNWIQVLGNSQSIYYAKEDSAFIGVNVIDCSEMRFVFKDGKISTARFDKNPDSVFYPMDEMKPEELKLKGFKWNIKARPKRITFKSDIL